MVRILFILIIITIIVLYFIRKNRNKYLEEILDDIYFSKHFNNTKYINDISSVYKDSLYSFIDKMKISNKEKNKLKIKADHKIKLNILK